MYQMKKLFANFKDYKVAVLVTLCLLVGQAYCDMTMPQLTSEIIDTGIQNRGIEHILPSKITEDDYMALSMVMTEDEREYLEKSYDEPDSSSGIRSLSSYGRVNAEALDEKLMEAVTLSYYAEKLKDGSFDDAGLADKAKEVSKNMAAPGAEATSGSLAGEALPIDEIRAGLKEMMAKTGEQTIKAMCISHAAALNERAGVDMDKIQTDYLWSCGFRMLLLAMVMIVLAALVSLISSRVGASIGRNLRSRVFETVMAYSGSEMDRFQTSSLITRATNDIQQVQMVTTMLLRMMMLAPVMAIWGIIKVYETKAHMSNIIVGSVLVMLVLISLLMAISLPKFRIMQKLVDRLNGVSRENLTGLPVIRAFCREKVSEERFADANGELKRTQLYVNRVMTFMSPMMMMIMFGTSILITWVAAHRIDDGTLQVGAMTAFITYAMMIIMSFMIMTAMSVILPRAGVAAERIDEVMSAKPEITDSPDAAQLVDCRGEVEFRNVSFRYPDADDCVIENISFTARPGETTAIIGSTGSGKTTMINLIPRFYDVSGGEILIDGRDIREYTLESLRDAIGYVPQKGVLFSGTIESNIGFGAKDASMEDIEYAACTAQAADFISEKEDGYDSHIAQGGSNVSGGQRQRLSIARALAKKPAILIFDDSFSALDMKTDARLRQALAEREKDQTKIIVAQRVGTILHAEQIIVLDDGRVAGRGTHDELMKTCDIYRQIAKSQLSAKDLGEVQ